MNKSTKTALHAMRKAELIDFTWNLIQHYNEATRRADELQTQIEHLERLLFKVREQANTIRTGEGEQY
jgi:prefoldin subunit 5